MNRYTGAFKIVAHPQRGNNTPVAMLELSNKEPAPEQDVLGMVIESAKKTHDTFGLSPRFKETDAGFRNQILADIRGITHADADVIIAARKELRVAMAEQNELVR